MSEMKIVKITYKSNEICQECGKNNAMYHVYTFYSTHPLVQYSCKSYCDECIKKLRRENNG
jgi:hypothetical protein